MLTRVTSAVSVISRLLRRCLWQLHKIYLFIPFLVFMIILLVFTRLYFGFLLHIVLPSDLSSSPRLCDPAIALSSHLLRC